MKIWEISFRNIMTVKYRYVFKSFKDTNECYDFARKEVRRNEYIAHTFITKRKNIT